MYPLAGWLMMGEQCRRRLGARYCRVSVHLSARFTEPPRSAENAEELFKMSSMMN